MRFGILGGGAIGSTFGGYLALAGHEVTLVDPWREHIEAVRRDGLVLRGPESDRVARPSATSDPAELAPVEVLLVSTKGFATEAAARSVAHAVPGDATVITLQNGIGNDRILAEVFAPEQVAPGTTVVGAQMLGPGVVSVSARTVEGGAETHLGPPGTVDEVPERLRELAAALTAAGLPTEALANARRLVWEKLVLSCSMTTASAVVQRTVGSFWGTAEGREIVRAMFDEVLALAHAEGVELDPDETWAQSAAVLDAAGDVYTSTSVDVMAGRQTEIGTLSLEVARRCEELGLDAPVSRTVGRYVRVLERLPPQP
jgi:2-dehydropantoate 2-reductase